MKGNKNKNSFIRPISIVSMALLILLFLCSFFFFSCTFNENPEDKIDIGEEDPYTQDPNVLVKEKEEAEDTETEEIEEESKEEDEKDKDNGDNGNGTGDENNSENGETDTETKEEESPDVTINVYYADSTVQYLAGEKRIISDNHKYLLAFTELLKPPIEPGHIKLVPDTTKINKINFDSGNINLDLSSEFIENRFKSDAVDILLVYSIVNTLTEFSEVNTVSFYINGERLNTLGQLDISQPIYRDTSWIKKD